MKEFLVRFKGSIRKFPCRFGCIQHDQSTKYVCLDKNFRVTDTSVYMALCCKMNDTINIILIKDLHDSFAVADISLNESVVLSVLNVLEVLKVSCIRQLVYIDDTDLVVVFLKHVMNVVGTDESGTACYQVCSHIFFSS